MVTGRSGQRSLAHASYAFSLLTDWVSGRGKIVSKSCPLILIKRMKRKGKEIGKRQDRRDEGWTWKGECKRACGSIFYTRLSLYSPTSREYAASTLLGANAQAETEAWMEVAVAELARLNLMNCLL